LKNREPSDAGTSLRSQIEIERAGSLASGTHIDHRPGFRETGFRNRTAETILLVERRTTMHATNSSVASPRGHKGVGMEGFIAHWYARHTAKDVERFNTLARKLAPRIKPRDRVLEIAPGPGYLAIELARLTDCRIVGVDISRTFVRIARDNAFKAGVDIAFDEGDAADLPLPSDGFDFIVCCAAFKNFVRPLDALDEMYRVLKPGGTALIVDLRKDFSPQEIDAYVRGKGVINGVLIKLTFNTMLKKRAYTQEALAQLVSQSRFGRGDVTLDALAFELWLHKPR
jgi:ubiquinone/menaquinone biosynthesis C-methylase UbiE